jgi:hypothetical protein
MASRLYAASLRPLISHGASAVCHRITAPDTEQVTSSERVVPPHPPCTCEGAGPGLLVDDTTG